VATKKGGKNKFAKKTSFVHLQKLMAAVSLLAFFVIAVAGLRANVGVVTITFRALLVILVVGIIGRVIVQILATYEEMNSGQA